MKTKTLAQFIKEELEYSELQFMGTIDEEVADILKNKDAKMENYNLMIKRFSKLEAMGKISNLVKNADFSISFN